MTDTKQVPKNSANEQIETLKYRILDLKGISNDSRQIRCKQEAQYIWLPHYLTTPLFHDRTTFKILKETIVKYIHIN